MRSSEIISTILNRLSFKQDDKDSNSFYKECFFGGNQLIVVRISNHRTYLNTWAERYKSTTQPSNKIIRRMGKNLPAIYRTKTFYSFVFEDEEDTTGNTQVSNNRRIIVYERVNKASNFDADKLMSYCNALQALTTSNQYNNGVLGDYVKVSNSTDENKRLNFKYDMNTNKKTIRLTETKFKQMLVECITKIIKEIA